MTKKKVLITSALPYANGSIHFGHIAGAYLPGDCYARYERLQHSDVLYICGSDEYGVAITMSAEMAQRSPQEHVDIFHAINKELFSKLHFSFDHYSRTSWPGHVETVQRFFLDLVENGYIEARLTDQLYSEADGKFLADRYVVGECPKCACREARGDECPRCGASYEATDLKNPISKISGAPLTLRSTKHWFLLLDKLREPLTNWMAKKEWKSNVINFVKGYIEELRPRAITRDSSWGIPIPLPASEGVDGKVLYVWFDAPIGYISATKEWAELQGDPKQWERFWLDPATSYVQFIGKDNIPFHAVIFPAMVMGQNVPYKLVDELPANEFFKLEGRQFSKSDGWYIDLEDFFSRYSADQIRYAIAANAPETGDSEFTWHDFGLRCNGELVGKYGNLVNRVMVFARQHCQGIIPRGEEIALEEVDKIFLAEVNALVVQASECYSSFKLRKATQTIMELAQLGNVYFDGKSPWRDAKDVGRRTAMLTTISCCMECIKALALISWPIIPTAAESIWNMLGQQSSILQMGWQAAATMPLPQGQQLGAAAILFKKIEAEQLAAEEAKLRQPAAAAAAVIEAIHAEETKMKADIGIDVVGQLDLRVVTIMSAEPIPKSDKLYKLQIDLGFEQRTVVSGIRPWYTVEELVGRRAIVIANLQATKIRGVLSQGMLLAASHGDKLELLAVTNPDIPNGSCIS